ncbi:hypothetical protein R6Q59_034184 [Mikania micrantha]
MTDPGIILFGKKIGLPETPNPPTLPAVKAACSSEHTLFTPHDQRKDDLDENPKTPSINEEVMSENPQSTDGETIPRTLKKPDKILPCPRCDSMNTKFCYFNNSNINQPRHFCKSCQRYWTAGGTMRNMPVGAGRRKKKNPTANCRYIISHEGLDSAAAAANHIDFASDSDGISPKVLSFNQNQAQFGDSLGGKENRDECCSNSVVQKPQNSNGFNSQVHWIPGGSWPYNPWNTPIPIPFPIPPICPPAIPMYPPPYWSSVSWLPPAGSILGKHSTDEGPNGSDEESKKQKSTVLIPKTLRIDDPDEAAKSSIWATLGIKNEHSSRGDLFKGFQSKGSEKNENIITPVLQANPAALSRSLCFQERA